MRKSTAIVSIGFATLTVGLGLSGHIPVKVSLAPCTPDEATVAILQSKLADALQRKADLLTRYNSRHPVVVNIEAEIQDIDRNIAAVMTQCKGRNIEWRTAETQPKNSLAKPLVAAPVAPVTKFQALRQAPADFLPSCSEGVSDSRPLPRNWPCDRAPSTPSRQRYNSRHPAVVNVEAGIQDIEPHAMPLPPVPERFPPRAVLQLVFSPPLIQRVQVPMPDMATCVQAIPQARNEFNPFLTECFVLDR